MANSISGKALAGATILLSGATTATTTAAPNGTYSFSGLAAGAYVVTPVKTGIKFVPASANETIVATDISGVNFLGTPVGTQGSTYTLQNVVDRVMSFADIEPVLNVGGFSLEPALTIANDVMTAICATPFPHKWNSTGLPLFYTWSWQQDYALVNPDGSSVYDIEWLEEGTAININSTAIPKPWARVECGRDLPMRTGTYSMNSGSQLGDPAYLASSLQNSLLYYGTWGAPNVGTPSIGNNPGPGSVYIDPLGATVLAASWLAGSAKFTLNYVPVGVAVASVMIVTGVVPTGYNGSWLVTNIDYTNPAAPVVTATMVSNPGTYQAGGVIENTAGQSMPANPINQIQDANGNLLVVTTYGTEGTTAPLAPVGATPGTTVSGAGATTVWTVVDPVGMGIRILNVPSQTGVVWQFNLFGQMPPPKWTSLDQTLAPLPDKYEPFFRAGFIAQCYRYSPEAKIRAKFKDEWMLWLKSLDGLREAQDRELEEYSFVPDRTVMGAGRRRNTFQGAAWPYNYPRP